MCQLALDRRLENVYLFMILKFHFYILMLGQIHPQGTWIFGVTIEFEMQNKTENFNFRGSV